MAALCFLSLAVLMAAPFLFFRQSLFLADFTYNIEPALRFMRDVWLKTGHLPIWNPYVMCGAPQIQLTWPIAYMPGYIALLAGLDKAQGLLFAFHFFVAGFGGFLWQYYGPASRSPGGRASSAILFGTAYMLCGYMTGSIVNPGLVGTAAWIPVILLLTEKLASRPRLWLLALTAFAFGQQITAGRQEIVASTVFIALARVCLILFGEKASALRWAGGLGCVLAAAALAVFFAAVDILPMVELVMHSPPAAGLATLKTGWWSAGWFDFLTVFLSQPLGRLSMGRYDLYPTCPGDMQYITSLYLGMPVLALACLGFLSPRFRERTLWAGIALLSVLVAAGEYTGVAAAVTWLCPDMQVFRYPIKMAIFLILPLVAAAAEGLRCLGRAEAHPAWLRIWPVACAAVVLAGVVLYFLPADALAAFLSAAGFVNIDREVADSGVLRRLPAELALAGTTGLLPWAAYRAGQSGRAGLTAGAKALVILCVLGLLSANGVMQLWQTVDVTFFLERPPVVRLFLQQGVMPRQDYRVASFMDDPLPVPPAVLDRDDGEIEPAFMQYARQVLRPNTGADAGVLASNGVSLIPGWHAYFLSTGLLPRSSLRADRAHPAGKSDLPLYRWCQVTCTRFIIAPRQPYAPAEKGEPPRLDPAYFRLIVDDPFMNMRVYEIDRVRPRAAVVFGARTVADRNQALTLINRSDSTKFDPLAETVVCPVGQAYPPAPATVRPPAGRAEIVSITPNRIEVEAEAAAPAYLVLADSWYPGWEAVDNGRESPVYLADGLVRAVHLKPGRHRVVFDYRPRSLFWGETASKLALILLVLMAATALGRRWR